MNQKFYSFLNSYGFPMGIVYWIFLCFSVPFFLFSTFLFSTTNYKDVDWNDRLEEYEKKEIERKVHPIELRIRLSERRLDAWTGLESRLKIFRDQSYSLYDPTRSPFNERVSRSTQPEFFTVTSDRSALSGEYSFGILQIAKKDRIGTKAFSKEQTLSPSSFQIRAGEEIVEIDFSKGGTLRDLYEGIYNIPNKPFDITLIPVRKEEEMLLISSKKNGLKNRILFSGDLEFFREVGFLSLPKDREKTEQGWDWKVLDRQLFQGDYSISSDGILSLKNQSMLGISFPKTLPLTPTMVVELRFRSQKVEKEEIPLKEKEKKEPKELPPLGMEQTVDIGDNQIRTVPLIPFLIRSSEEEQFILADETEKTKEANETLTVEAVEEKETENPKRAWIQLVSSETLSTKEQSLISTQGEWKTLRLELQDLIEEKFPLRKIIFRNESKEEQYELDQLKIHDPFAGAEEYNFLERAQNAQFQLNGVELSREKNEINNVIQGVNITLKKPGEGKIIVGSNADRILEEIKKFLDEYNNVMLYLKNLMDLNTKPIFTFADLEERDKEWENKSYEELEFARLSGERYQGYMRSEQSLRSLKTQLRGKMVTTPYERDSSESIRFLQQIGFQNPENFAEAVDLENVRAGYLVLDEEVLKSSLKSNQEEVLRILAHSSEGTLIKNKGIAVQIVQILDNHVKKNLRDESGRTQTGLIALKKKSLETSLRLNQKRLSNAQELVQKRKERFQKDINKILQAQEQGEFRRQQIQNSLNLQR